MARSVADVALLLSVQAGHDRHDPLSLGQSGHAFAASLARHLEGLRIAWTPDLDALPVDAEVAKIVEAAAHTFRDLGCVVERACPDLREAMAVFQVQRAAALAVTAQDLETAVPDWRDHVRETTAWNIDQGLSLDARTLLDSEVQRTRIYRRTVEFFDRFDALLLPAAQVPPFAIELD